MPSIDWIMERFSMLRSKNTPYASPAVDDANNTLINVKKLDLSDKDSEIFTSVNQAVIDYMSGPLYKDHTGYAHVQRIVSLIYKIYTAHKHDSWIRDVDPIVIYLAGLVHEIGGPQSIRDANDFRDHEDIMRDFLKQHGCIDPRIYAAAAFVAARVSLARELRESEDIKAEAEAYPGLRIVQDAVRLDGLGVDGLKRCVGKGAEVDFDVLKKSVELMKTKEGKKWADQRVKFMEKCCGDWKAQEERAAVS